jgi:hypothetical protein
MRRFATIAGTLACAALLWAASAAAATSPSRPGLLAEAARLHGELELLGQLSTPVDLPRNGTVVQLRLENRDGYRIAVLAFGQTVLLGVSRGHSRFPTTIYLTHGRVTPTSIRASFAGRGRIAVRFRPPGQTLRLPRRFGCKGPGHGVIARFGVYVGELSFQGEGGYTSARARRMKGSSIDLAALTSCLRHAARGPGAAFSPARSPAGLLATAGPAGANQKTPSPPGVPTHPSTGPKPTTLVADSKLPLSRTLFAAQAHVGGRARFLALEESSEGSIGIVRYVLVPGPRAAFAFDDPLSLAGVTPPAPFSGSATFRHGPGGAKSWTGSLAVSFLGAPDVPLTGSQFSTQLTRGW